MKTSNAGTGDLVAVMLTCGVAAGLFCAPDAVTRPLETGIRDALRPGLIAAESLRSWGGSQLADRRDSPAAAATAHDELARDLERWQLLARQSALRNARLRHELAAARRGESLPAAGTPGDPLLVPELLEARVLGRQADAAWRAGALLDRGRDHGLVEDSVILEDERPLIDQGETEGLRSGQPVYAGRTVVGRVARVGRWTSTLLPVRHSEFRGAARLGRHTDDDGLMLGARGILEGTGTDECRLKYVPATEPVGIGDEVYTDRQDSVLSEPMFYGTVTRAELPPGAPHWEIGVTPAAPAEEINRVAILRSSVNAARISAN